MKEEFLHMTNLWQSLENHPRLLLEAQLKPVQGTRFQPTGFPDLGAATYEAPNNEGRSVQMILVESAQSMANRLEAICWDGELYPALSGMPFVSVDLWGTKSTNSLLEAHRLNSPYIMHNENFKERFRTDANLQADKKDVVIFNRRALAHAAFKYDPNSILHGVFLEKLDGRARLQRCLSGFIEAYEVDIAGSGGVKNDRVAPSPKDLNKVNLKVSAADGYGNVPFHRTEYTAKRITAYFNLDLVQIRAYALGEVAERFLVTLALWKIRKFLDTSLRLRTACDLDLIGELKITRPKDGVVMPTTIALEVELPSLIDVCTSKGLFAEPPITLIKF